MDGLPDNQANALYIENNNSIWVTTNNGVAIFNGETFRTIYEPDNDKALSFGPTSAVTKSKDGVFFFGQGNRGVIIYDPNSLRNITKSDGFKRRLFLIFSLIKMEIYGQLDGGVVAYN